MKCVQEGGFTLEEHKPKEIAQTSLHRELPEVTSEVIEKLNESLSNLSIHLAQTVGQKGQPKRAEEREPRPRRVLQCWNCGESGHGMYNCPWPRGEPGRPNLNYPVMNAGDGADQQPRILQRPNGGPGLARPQPREADTIPPLPDPKVHVVEVSNTKDVDIEANGIKRGRGKAKEKEGATSQSDHGRGKKAKETKEVKKSRRRINLQDFPLGHGMAPYNLLDDMRGKGPNISWPQFLALCPQVRRELSRVVSTRRKVKDGVPVVKIAQAEVDEDIAPVLDCYIKGRLVREGLVDGGAQICIMTEVLMHKLGLHIHETPDIKVKMANNSKAKCLGIVKDVNVEVFGMERPINFYVMSAKGNGYPFILGRPWLRKMRALQDWESGRLICRNEDSKKIVFNMKEQRQEELQEESTETETDEYSTDDTSEQESSGSPTDEESSIEVMGVRFRPTKQESTCQGLEEVGSQEDQNGQSEEMLDGMLSKTLSWEERHEYICMLQKFPRLFAKDYTDVRGVDVIQHKIDLKPQATPKAQKLRRLGVIKEQALLKEVRKLLSAGFIYPVEN